MSSEVICPTSQAGRSKNMTMIYPTDHVEVQGKRIAKIEWMFKNDRFESYWTSPISQNCNHYKSVWQGLEFQGDLTWWAMMCPLSIQWNCIWRLLRTSIILKRLWLITRNEWGRNASSFIRQADAMPNIWTRHISLKVSSNTGSGLLQTMSFFRSHCLWTSKCKPLPCRVSHPDAIPQVNRSQHHQPRNIFSFRS